MSSQVVVNGMGDADKARLEAYWSKKYPRLQKLLASYPTALQDSRLIVGRHEQAPDRPWHEVRAVVNLPTGTLAAHADDEDPETAIDRVTEALATEIGRHRERLFRAARAVAAEGPADAPPASAGRRLR